MKRTKKEEQAVFLGNLGVMSIDGEQLVRVLFRGKEFEAWVTKVHDPTAPRGIRWSCRIPYLQDWRIGMKIRKKKQIKDPKPRQGKLF